MLGVEYAVLAYDAHNADDLVCDGDFILVAVDDKRGVAFAHSHHARHPLVALVHPALVPLARRFPERLLWVERSVNAEEVLNLHELFSKVVQVVAA